MDMNVNKIINNYLEELDSFSLPSYERLPDIDLYMEQMVTYLEKSFRIFETSSLDQKITKSMINNYVKGKVIDAPNLKRYDKHHVALLEEVITLKEVLSINEIKQILDTNKEIDQSIAFNEFKDKFKNVTKAAVETCKNELEKSKENDVLKLTDISLELALYAQAYNNLSKKILFLISHLLLKDEEKPVEE